MPDHNDEEQLQQLVKSSKSGDTSALHELLVRIQGVAERRARSVLLNHADVEDAVQCTLIICAAKLESSGNAGSYDGRGSFDGWVNTIALNEANGLLRKKRRRSEPGPDSVPEYLPSTSGSSIFANRMMIEACLAKLSEQEQAAMYLRHNLRYQYEEIARHTGEPLGTIKARVSRAREKMARCIFQTDPDLRQYQ